MRSPHVEPILRIVAASKVYGGVHAIEGVDFDLRPGEIHAVLGENGAGKSTLCKAIAGAVQLSSGEYFLGGKKVQFSTPGEALKKTCRSQSMRAKWRALPVWSAPVAPRSRTSSAARGSAISCAAHRQRHPGIG